jgi:hypothetical protein
MLHSGGISGRREFLGKMLATTAFGFASLRGGLRETFAAAAATGKPLLNQASLDAMIPKNPTQFRAAAQEARKDLKGFLRNHFTLAPAQEKTLQSLAQPNIDKIINAIDTAVQKSYRLQVHLSGSNENPTESVSAQVQKIRDVAAPKEPGLQVGPFTVTADGSYSHSDGFSGTVSFSVPCG